jgi:hypothetical protein
LSTIAKKIWTIKALRGWFYTQKWYYGLSFPLFIVFSLIIALKHDKKWYGKRLNMMG